MSIEKFSSQIRELVGKDELKEAIKQLKNFLKESPKLDDVLMQSAQLSRLQKQIRNDTISFENAGISRNKIGSAILSLAVEIEDRVSSNEVLRKEFESQLMTDNKPTIINQKHTGSGDNIGGNKVINN